MTDPHSIGNQDPIQNQDPTFVERMQDRFANLGGYMLQKASEHPVLATFAASLAIGPAPAIASGESTLIPPKAKIGQADLSGSIFGPPTAQFASSGPKSTTVINKEHLKVKMAGPSTFAEYGLPLSYTVTEVSPKSLKGMKFRTCCDEQGRTIKWTDNLVKNRPKKHKFNILFNGSNTDINNDPDSLLRGFDLSAKKNDDLVFWRTYTVKKTQ